jgi:hypothetical protein
MKIDYFRMFDIARYSQEHGKPGDARAIHLSGNPGNRKSSLIRQYAEHINYWYYPILLGQVDPMDMSDMYVPNFDTKTLEKIGLEVFTNPSIPEGYDGLLVHFEEVRDGQPESKAIMKTLVGDRYHSGQPIHPKCIFMASSNYADAGCGGTELTQSEMARFIDLPCEPVPAEWLEYAAENDVDFDIRLFIHQFPGELNEFDPTCTEFGQPSMRSWSQLSCALSQTKKDEMELRTMLAECYVGKAAGHAFMAFTMLEEAIPTDRDILSDPEHAVVPENMSAKSAIICMMSEWAKRRRVAGSNVEPADATAIITYFRQFPEALAVYGIRMITKEHEDIANIPAYGVYKSEVDNFDL